MKILVIGGAGYVGSSLVPDLLEKGHEVTVLDLFLYGKEVFTSFKSHSNLQEIVADVRDISFIETILPSHECVIHLACISNDPSFALDPFLGKSINLDSFAPLVQSAKNAHVRKFIFASSSSVYGVKDTPNVNETMSLEPLTDYSKFKAECEKILLESADDDFITTVIRPATVCGYAPRQRLDVIVNILTNLAYNKGEICVMGGNQMRPNIHIKDMVRAYICILDAPEKMIQKQIFNVGYDNYTVLEIAQMVQEVVGKERSVSLKQMATNDPRSYHICSEKIKKTLGFSPIYTIYDAIQDLIDAWKRGDLPNSLTDARYFNIETMRQIGLR